MQWRFEFKHPRKTQKLCSMWSKCVLLLWSNGMRKWECWRLVLFYFHTLNDSTNDLNDDKNRNPHVDYNASCEWVWGTILTTTARSLFGMLDVVLQHHVCHLNDWKKGTWHKVSRCKWINWESKEVCVAFPIKTSFNAYLNSEAQMKGILCPISSQLIQFMFGAWHFSAFFSFWIEIASSSELNWQYCESFFLLSLPGMQAWQFFVIFVKEQQQLAIRI